jgi:hypothetical protein
VSHRAYLADHKCLANLAFSAKNSRFSNPWGGKFDQAANDNPLKMMDVGSLSGKQDPRFEFGGTARVGPLRLPADPRDSRKTPTRTKADGVIKLSYNYARGESVRLWLVRGSARYKASGPGLILNGVGRVLRADVL